MNSSERGRAISGLIVVISIAALLVLGLGMRSCFVGVPGLHILDSQGFIGPGNWFGLFGLGGLIQICLAFWVGYDAHHRGMNGWLWGLLVLFTFIIGLLVYLIVGQSMQPRSDGSNFARSAPPGFGGAPSPAGTATAPGGTPHAPTVVQPVAPAPHPSSVDAQAAPVVDAAPPTAPSEPTCPSCGAGVQADYKVCPHCAGALRCRSCSEPLGAGWKVCPQCATPIARPESGDVD